MRDDLRDLGVQALSHLGAAVVHEDRAVAVDMHQCAGLVQVLHVERDAELDGGQCDAALEQRARCVELGERDAARAVVAGPLELVDDLVNDVVLNCLAVRRGVALAGAVEVDAPHVERITPERARHVVDDDFGDDRALRPAKAAKRRVALRVRLRRVTVQRDIGQPVGVVDVAQRARHHRPRQVGRVAGVRDQRDLDTEHPTVVVVAGLVLVIEAVTPPGDEEIVVAVDAQLDRSIQCLRRDGRDAGELRRLRLLAAEATAHAPAFDLYLVRSQLQRTRYGVLHLARVLRRAMHEHRVVFLRDRIADLAFEVELLLPADCERAAQAMRRVVNGRARAAIARVAREVHRRQHVLAFRMRLFRRQHGWQRVDL